MVLISLDGVLGLGWLVGVVGVGLVGVGSVGVGSGLVIWIPLTRPMLLVLLGSIELVVVRLAIFDIESPTLLDTKVLIYTVSDKVGRISSSSIQVMVFTPLQLKFGLALVKLT